MSRSLLAALTATLPRPEQTLLLRASLAGSIGAHDDALAAWRGWRDLVGDAKAAIVADRGSIKRLLPALYAALRTAGADPDRDLFPYLKLAFVREEMRMRTYVRVFAEVLDVLARAGVDVLALRGGPLAVAAYPDPAQRHCHDVALLVRADDALRTRDALVRAGWESLPVVPGEGPAAVLRHETSLPVEVHTDLFGEPFHSVSFDVLWERSVPLTVRGVTARTLAADDALAHTCVHASYSSSRESLRWVGDAWHIVRTDTALDWDRLVATAVAIRASAQLYTMLAYVSRLGAAVPDGVLRRLRVLALHASPLERDVALHGARTGACTDVSALLSRMDGRRTDRVRVIGWLLMPSRAYLRKTWSARAGGSIGAQYLRRPLRYARRVVSPAR